MWFTKKFSKMLFTNVCNFIWYYVMILLQLITNAVNDWFFLSTDFIYISIICIFSFFFEFSIDLMRLSIFFSFMAILSLNIFIFIFWFYFIFLICNFNYSNLNLYIFHSTKHVQRTGRSLVNVKDKFSTF
jgi:hypothetical protein